MVNSLFTAYRGDALLCTDHSYHELLDIFGRAQQIVHRNYCRRNFNRLRPYR